MWLLEIDHQTIKINSKSQCDFLWSYFKIFFLSRFLCSEEHFDHEKKKKNIFLKFQVFKLYSLWKKIVTRIFLMEGSRPLQRGRPLTKKATIKVMDSFPKEVNMNISFHLNATFFSKIFQNNMLIFFSKRSKHEYRLSFECYILFQNIPNNIPK